jgi:D-Tyr-tRNAtyr deacylase
VQLSILIEHLQNQTVTETNQGLKSSIKAAELPTKARIYQLFSTKLQREKGWIESGEFMTK